MLESPLSWENYAEKFQLLLYLEELQMEVDIRRYNIPNNDREHAVMVRDPVNKKLLILEVNVCLLSFHLLKALIQSLIPPRLITIFIFCSYLSDHQLYLNKRNN